MGVRRGEVCGHHRGTKRTSHAFSAHVEQRIKPLHSYITCNRSPSLANDPCCRASGVLVVLPLSS